MWILRWCAGHILKGLSETWKTINSWAYLSKRCVEVDDVDFRLQVGGFQWSCHSKNTTAMIPLDTHHIHLCVNTHRAWQIRKQASWICLSRRVSGIFYLLSPHFHHFHSAWSGTFHCRSREQGRGSRVQCSHQFQRTSGYQQCWQLQLCWWGSWWSFSSGIRSKKSLRLTCIKQKSTYHEEFIKLSLCCCRFFNIFLIATTQHLSRLMLLGTEDWICYLCAKCTNILTTKLPWLSKICTSPLAMPKSRILLSGDHATWASWYPFSSFTQSRFPTKINKRHLSHCTCLYSFPQCGNKEIPNRIVLPPLILRL